MKLEQQAEARMKELFAPTYMLQAEVLPEIQILQ